MAPEQARGEIDRLDERADIYSICAQSFGSFSAAGSRRLEKSGPATRVRRLQQAVSLRKLLQRYRKKLWLKIAPIAMHR